MTVIGKKLRAALDEHEKWKLVFWSSTLEHESGVGFWLKGGRKGLRLLNDTENSIRLGFIEKFIMWRKIKVLIKDARRKDLVSRRNVLIDHVTASLSNSLDTRVASKALSEPILNSARDFDSSMDQIAAYNPKL